MGRPHRNVGEENQRRESSQEDRLVCTDASQGEMVYDYFNDALAETSARKFEEHLLLCFHCQDIILSLDSIFDLLAENSNLLHDDPR
jgi:hypothetical protein